MKGEKNVIEALNKVLTGELTAINQYFLHSSMCRTWGYVKLAAKSYEESIEEMKHARDITNRILLLEGLPNMQQLDRLYIGENVKEVFEGDLKLEMLALERLKKGIAICEKAEDHVSRELLETILKDEEMHVEWLEAQMNLISQVGLENYLAQQIHA